MPPRPKPNGHRPSPSGAMSPEHEVDLEQGRSLSRESRRSAFAASEPLPEPQAAFNTARPGAWRAPATTLSSKIFAQLLGLNPFKNTYLSLYDPLDSILDKSIAIGSAIFAVVGGVPLPVIGYIFGQIINEFPPQEKALYDRLVQLLGVATGYFVVTAIYTIGFGLTAENVSIKLRQQLLNCLLYLDQAYLDTHDIDVNGLLTEKMDTIQAGCSEKVGIFIQAISYFVAAFVVGFMLNAKLTGILLASVVPAIGLTFYLLSPAISKASTATTKHSEAANDVVESALGAVKIVQAFDMIGQLCRKHVEHLEESTRSAIKKSSLAALQAGMVYFIAYAANALAFYLGSRIATQGNAGTVYAVVFLILDASFVVGQFAPFLEIFARAASAKQSIQELLNVQKDADNTSTFRKSNHKPNIAGRPIEFRNVEFQYPARPTVKTLKGMNISFQPGTLNAVVGTSGGGKSTLVALLLGIYDYAGQIMIGQEDIKIIDSNHLRSQISVVEQDSILFSGSLFDNVCYGLVNQDVSDDEKLERCHEVLRIANVDFLNKLPHGIHTRLGNETQLSGGQRQRICLARALIKRPSVLVLDEPTAALDARTEVAVMDAVKNVVASGTTVIMIAHRLSTTLDADSIAVVSDGQVVESGTPVELSAEGMIFRGLLDAQKTNFNDSRDQSPDTNVNLHLSRTKSSQRDKDTTSDENPSVDSSRRAKYSLRRVGRRVISIAKPDGWLIPIGLLASTLGGGILLGQALVFGNLIQLLNTGTSNPSYYERADFFCLMFFVLSLIALASYLASGSAFGVVSARLTGRLQTNLLRKVLHLDLQWFSDPGRSVHGLMSSFTKDPGDLSALGGVAMGAIFTIVTSVAGGIILSHIIAWKIAVVLLAAVPIMLVAGWARLRLLTASEVQHRDAYKTPTSLAAESCRNRRTVTALGLEQHVLDEYRQALDQPHRHLRLFVYYSNTLLAFCFSITYFLYALAYWWGSRQVRNGTYSTTDFFIVLPALLFSAQSAGQFFSLSPEIARAKTAARSIFTLLDEKPSIMQQGDVSSSTQASSKIEKSDSPESSMLFDKGSSKLEFRDVSLTYPNSRRAALKNINITIARGQRIAFVGPSGAGKSSAMALIERFWDPTSGTMLFDGIDMRDEDVRWVRGHMGLVSQDPDLFSGSIAYNVKLGASSGVCVTDEQVEEACKKCGLHDFIASLPEGYNTETGSSSSSQLSGGQKQRLAIARALVRNPEILLLDEVTSALDARTEAHVQAALAEAAKDRTTVIVAHRLASIQHVDQIYVFDHGRVVEEGTHAELIEQGGLYASMAKAQSLA